MGVRIIKNKLSLDKVIELYKQTEDYEALTTYRPLAKFVTKDRPIIFLPQTRKRLRL